MSKEWQWSLETYKLNKIVEIFGTPCVIRLTEGYLSDDESEEFAQGDIMTIDTELVSDKVAAMFTRCKIQEVQKPGKQIPDYGIITLNQPEVFLPYGYDGKLKVLKTISDVSCVKELAGVFPRYATLRENLSVKTNLNESVKLSKGTQIELDRILPGQTYGKDNEADKLVIQFKHSGNNKIAALSFNTKGKFHTEEDHNEYTLCEAIDRYGLPLDVKFCSNEIKQIFDQEVKDGRRPYTKVTGTLRLNRIVKQHVLIGHYKPISEHTEDQGGADANKSEDNKNADTTAKDIRKRTVIVLPVDNPEIGNIEVNIYDGDVLTIYEKLVNIQSVSEAKDMVRDTLCVDFSVKPGIKLIEEATRKYENLGRGKETEKDTSYTKDERSICNEPPPLPKRPAHLQKITGATGGDVQHKKDTPIYSSPPNSHYKQLPKQRPVATEADLENDYEIPAKSEGLTASIQGYLSMDKVADDTRPPLLPRKPKQLSSMSTDAEKTGKEKKPPKGKHWPSIKSPFKSHPKKEPFKMVVMPRVPEVPVVDDGLDGYEELSAFQLPFGRQNIQIPKPLDTACSKNDLGDYDDLGGSQQTAVAVVRPVANDPAIPPDSVNEGYEEIDEIIALRRQMPEAARENTERNGKDLPVTGETASENQTESRTGTAVEHLNTNAAENEQATNVQEPPVGNTDTTDQAVQRPEAVVSPSSSNSSRQTHKLLKDLTNEELVERLHLCNIPDLADICKSENLDGAFFEDVSVDFLKETMGLQGLKLAKFLKMKDENWVPK